MFETSQQKALVMISVCDMQSTEIIFGRDLALDHAQYSTLSDSLG